MRIQAVLHARYTHTHTHILAKDTQHMQTDKMVSVHVIPTRVTYLHMHTYMYTYICTYIPAHNKTACVDGSTLRPFTHTYIHVYMHTCIPTHNKTARVDHPALWPFARVRHGCRHGHSHGRLQHHILLDKFGFLRFPLPRLPVQVRDTHTLAQSRIYTYRRSLCSMPAPTRAYTRARVRNSRRHPYIHTLYVCMAHIHIHLHMHTYTHTHTYARIHIPVHI
jgi:hypothetical protein